jgi:catechol 2,3-dioxygenase-like lactoylglutathione lyase family enzyme
MTLEAAPLVAFVGTRDPDASHRFYADVLGLELVESSSFANVYDAAGTMLRVTRVDEPARAPYTVLGWRVDDIRATTASLRERGVEFVRFDGMEQDADGVWVSPSGARIVWFRDPDGNLLSLQG